jgi:hypothetical protein
MASFVIRTALANSLSLSIPASLPVEAGSAGGTLCGPDATYRFYAETI